MHDDLLSRSLRPVLPFIPAGAPLLWLVLGALLPALVAAQSSYSSATLTDDGTFGDDRIVDLAVDDEGSIYALAQLRSPLDLDRDGVIDVNGGGQPMLTVVKYSRDLELLWEFSLAGDLRGEALRLHVSPPSSEGDPSDRVRVWVAANFVGPVRLVGEDESFVATPPAEEARGVLLYRVSQDGHLDVSAALFGASALATDLEMLLGGFPLLAVLFQGELDLDGDGSGDLGPGGDRWKSAILRFGWEAMPTDTYVLASDDDDVFVDDMAVTWSVVGTDVATAHRDLITLVGGADGRIDFPSPRHGSVVLPSDTVSTPSGFIADLIDFGSGIRADRTARIGNADRVCRVGNGPRIVSDENQISRLNGSYVSTWTQFYSGAQLTAVTCDERGNVFVSEASGGADLDRDGARDDPPTSAVREVVFALDANGVTRWMRPIAGPSTMKALVLDPAATLHGGGWFDNTIDIFADGSLDHVIFGANEDGLVVRFDSYLRLQEPLRTADGALLPLRTERGAIRYEIEVIGNLEVGDMRESEGDEQNGAHFKRSDGACTEEPERDCAFFFAEGEAAPELVELELWLLDPEKEGVLIVHAIDEEGKRHSSLPCAIPTKAESE